MEVHGFGKPSLRYAVTLSSILSSSVGQNEAGVICEGEEVKRAHVLTGGYLTTERLALVSYGKILPCGVRGHLCLNSGWPRAGLELLN